MKKYNYEDSFVRNLRNRFKVKYIFKALVEGCYVLISPVVNILWLIVAFAILSSYNVFFSDYSSRIIILGFYLGQVYFNFLELKAVKIRSEVLE